uniref:Transposase, MuDR, MULE transposase domain protein n=1 Tax=Tanacetum cinerariifolium TaxID=118510 RepID=A0A6L2L3Z9_TANCI|nr:transposase, MuDR, MULE transposase domain protein [Tanacetum cinerariifolium]
MALNIGNFKCLIHYNETQRGAIMSEDLRYSMLHEMMMKKFNLEANSQLNLSFKLSSFDYTVDITDDIEICTFLKYLRPVLMIDVAHLNGLYKGTNLVAVAMDGNNQIVPIAFGICKGETDSVESVNARSVKYRKDPVLKLQETYRAMVQQCNTEQVRLTVLTKLQEALDEEAILEEHILALMHRFADRFTDRRVEINNLMVLHDHPLIDYGADMKKCVYLKIVRDELLRNMEEKRQLMTNYRDM